ncbi:MAG: hypothetical protein ACI8S6_002776 [Myxococcota bacterium]
MTLDGGLDAAEADTSAVSARVSSIEGDYLTSSDLSGYATSSALSSLDDRVDDLEVIDVDDINDLMSFVSVDTSDDSVTFSVASVYINSGSGSTNGTLTGLGNLIVGYDESYSSDKSGSHNLVVDKYHSYTS